MTYPVFDTSGLADAAETPTGPVTCAECGCRLQHSAENGIEGWFHFAPMNGRDARGCIVACADAVHDAKGRARATAAA
jgi:hypothetical protein